jgi:NAD(P)-dependent dehydrogenase (short-subunit alcohol dehydrogenase family)
MEKPEGIREYKLNFRMKSIIITGANSGIGFECALQIAKIAPDEQIILACRNKESANEAIVKIQHETNHRFLVFIPLDLASLQSIREFVKIFSQLQDPVVTSLINNAGGLFVGNTAYTKDGFELTYGTNHLGPFCLTLLLLPYLESGASITFVSSGVHDPANKTGIQVPVYTSGKELAFPKETNEKKFKMAQRRYSTSKLCNVLTTYILHEKLANKNIRINAFDPGQVPGTGFLRTLPAPMRFIAKNIMPLFNKKMNSAALSGGRLANLAHGKELKSLNGIYYSGGEVKQSSADSYNKSFQSDLWQSSIELTGLKQEETNLNLAEK